MFVCIVVLAVCFVLLVVCGSMLLYVCWGGCWCVGSVGFGWVCVVMMCGYDVMVCCGLACRPGSRCECFVLCVRRVLSIVCFVLAMWDVGCLCVCVMCVVVLSFVLCSCAVCLGERMF